MDVKIDKVIIVIGKKEIELTWEEMVALKEKLNELLKDRDVTKPLVPILPEKPDPYNPWVPLTPCPTYPWNPNYPYSTIIWCSTNNEGTLKIIV